jgi:adenylosuccinate synthase
MTELALMKLDVLSRFETVKVAVGYEVDGKKVEDFPIEGGAFERTTPIYEEFPGWGDDIMSVSRYADLPAAARDYVEWIEAQIGVPVSLVSVGPGREQTLLRR